MKIVVLILSIFASSGFTCAWADDLAMAAAIVDSTHIIQGGTIKSVTWADPLNKGSKSEIVVLNTQKKTTNIYVTSTTTFWDADAKAILQDKILAHAHVNVIYTTTPEGINIAQSIKVLK